METDVNPLPLELQNLIVANLSAAQDPQWGGFGSPPGANSIETTYHSIASLSMLGQLDALRNPAMAGEFIARCQNDDGGFGDSPAMPSFVEPTHFAIAVARLLGTLGAIDINRAASWLAHCQQTDPLPWPRDAELGGFRAVAKTPGGYQAKATPINSMHCLAGLALLGPIATQPINLDGAMDYARRRWNEDGFWPSMDLFMGDDLCERAVCMEYLGLSLSVLLDIPFPEQTANKLTDELLAYLKGIDERDDYTDAHFINTYEVYFNLAAFGMLGGQERIDDELHRYLTQFVTFLASDGTDHELGPYKVGIAALPYSGNKEFGGDIHARSTFFGLATLALLSGSPFDPALSFPNKGTLPNIGDEAPSAWSEYYTCFMSFSFSDMAFVNKLRDELSKRGVPHYFAPDRMRVGESLPKALAREIRSHDRFLLILSHDAIGSAWVQKEIEHALEECNRRGSSVIVPIAIDDCTANMSEDTVLLANLKDSFILDAKNWEDPSAFDSALERLLDVLRRPT